MRRTCGFALKVEGNLLTSFGAFSTERGKDYVCADVAIEWAGLARTANSRARRLAHVIRFARYARAEDPRHELPPAVYGRENRPRPVPYIFSSDDIRRLVLAAFQLGRPSLRRDTYGTLFALLACTGLRVSEAIHLRYDDITTDGLLIRYTKFRKSRLVPLHHTAREGLENYLKHRRPYAPFDDHVFVSLRRKPLLVRDVETAFHAALAKLGLSGESGHPRPTVHSLRHTFAVRALENCPDGRDHITQHMLSLSTYLGHSNIANTYWYLEATSELMRSISERCEHFVTGEQL